MKRAKVKPDKRELPAKAKALKERLKLPRAETPAAQKAAWAIGKTKVAREEAEQRLAVDLYEHYGYKSPRYEKHKETIENGGDDSPSEPIKPNTPPAKGKGRK